MAGPSDAAAPITAANVVKHEGKWVYLDEASAKRHPLYGIDGWAKFLLCLLVLRAIGGGVQGASAVATLSTVGIIFGMAAIGVSAYQFFVAMRLQKRLPDFQRRFLILFLVLSATVLAVSVADVVAEPASAQATIARCALDIGVAGLCCVYVFRSVRINVTRRKRVRSDDKLVLEYIVDLSPRLPKAAKY